MEIDNDIVRLVKERLMAMPSNISFSIGSFGEFTRDELIREVEEGTEAGTAMIEMQIEFIKQMPQLLKKHGKT